MKVFLAATQSRHYLVKQFKPPYVLETFYGIDERYIPLFKNCEMFLLDSGAFTFMNKFKGEVNWKEYIDSYIDFINKYDIKYFFELDIDVVVGYKNVLKIRKYIESKTRKKSIPVWHKSRGLEEFEKMCKEYDYVAIGGLVTKEIKPSEYKFLPKLISVAHKNNCKIHGLGFTRTKELHKFHFDSVDSTNWLSASRFGTVEYFNGSQMQKTQRPPNTKMKHYKQVDAFVFNEWIKFQRYADKYL